MELSKYEYTRIIGARALQLFCGAPPLIKITNPEMTFMEVAEKEFEKGVIPLSVIRKRK